jgi:Ricin-type beta-trefoil lectin domain-like
MTAFDGNAWYQITESRVDFNSSLQILGQGLFFSGQCGTCTNQKWQMQLDSSGQYQLKNSASGVSKQLSVCYTPAETDSSKTQPCMLPSSGDDSQKWRVDPWGDGTFKFVNVGNGSKYNMDCHPGNPLFMSSQTAATPKQPAQHWEFSSIGVINDGAYSTTVSTTTVMAAPHRWCPSD